MSGLGVATLGGHSNTDIAATVYNQPYIWDVERFN